MAGKANHVQDDEKNDNVSVRVEEKRDFYAASFEERLYYGNLERARLSEERKADGLKPSWFEHFLYWMDPAVREVDKDSARLAAKGEALASLDRDKENAHRMLKTATWLGSFYLITTDILGPFNSGYAFSTLGYVGGFLLYAVFGGVALYSSFLLLYLYVRLDSDKHPVRNYGDVMHICINKPMRIISQSMQVFQLIFVTATVVLANAQSLNQLSRGKLCFIVGVVIMTLVCWAVSQIRSLRILSWVGSISVYLNLLTIFISMGVIAHSAPNYESAAATYGYSIDPPAPIMTYAIAPGTLSNKINGAMNMVFAWGGLMIFPEMIAEMGRPMDFWKSVILAQALIFCVYAAYGAFLYGMQGQYVLPVSFQGVSPYKWQSVGNTFTLVTYSIAGALYCNIACKVVYSFLFEDLTHGPPLMSFKGRIYWTGIVIVFFVLAFVIGTAIPQVQTLQSLIGAAFLLQFSYMFPPLAALGFNMKRDAAVGEKAFSPESPTLARRDTFSQLSRWKRGFFSKSWLGNTFNLCLVLAALATAGLGIYGSALTIKATFANSAATSFSCTSPV